MSTRLGEHSEVGKWSEFCVALSSRLEVLWSSERSVFCSESSSSSNFK